MDDYDEFAQDSYLTDAEVRLLEELVEAQKQIKAALEWSVAAISQMQKNYDNLQERVDVLSQRAKLGADAYAALTQMTQAYDNA